MFGLNSYKRRELQDSARPSSSRFANPPQPDTKCLCPASCADTSAQWLRRVQLLVPLLALERLPLCWKLGRNGFSCFDGKKDSSKD